jgi:hypothetical protein
MLGKTNGYRTVAAGALIGAALLAPASAGAQGTSAPEEDWRFRASIYGWFPGLSGTTEFPSGATGPTIDVNAKDLLDKLKMAFMGTFEVQRGRWGGLIDWVYTDVGATKSATRDFSFHGQQLPLGLTADLSLDVKTNIGTFAGTYALIENPAYSMGLVFGARMLDVDQTLNWSLSGNGPIGVARAGTVTVSATNWDGIVGVRGRARFGEDRRWFVPYYVDIGTGQSDLTWQAIAGLGYSFSWGEIVAAWRYLDYDFDAGQPIQSLTFNGVAVGVSFRF